MYATVVVMLTDVELFEGWRAGVKVAGEALFARHFAEVFRFFEQKVGARAEDLTQQTFLECTRGRERFRGESSFRTYLFAIAWNELRQYFRREIKNRHIDFEVSSLDELTALATSPSSRLDQVKRAERIRGALGHLPVSQQVLLEYHYWHELDAAALAEIFETTAAAIRVRLVRARAALRQRLALAPRCAASGDPTGRLSPPRTEVVR